MPDFRFLLRVSRPRFWFYIFGPYIVGLIAGVVTRNELLDWRTILFAVYFLFPANLLIYGVNDIFDYETDRLNEKKLDYESLVETNQHKSLAIWIAVFNLPCIITALIFVSTTWIALTGFLFFSIFYSAPPIRAKAIPFLDSAFNILYIFPGVFGYQILTGNFPPMILLIAAGLWTSAMHAYSAIPDIEADKKAGLKTIATVCGAYGTLAVCFCLYLAAAILSFSYLGFICASLGGIYLIIMLASAFSVKNGSVFKLYRWFPIINAISGAVIFWQIALDKLL